MKSFLKAGLVASLALGLGTAADAATINVTTVVDEADGSCADGDCSLRDAVSSALPGDTVAVPAGTYVLTLGEIFIGKNLNVTGAGARSTIIDGNAASRVFLVGSFGGSEIVEISDLTIRNGAEGDFGRGGGIQNQATLTLTRCLVTNNRAFNAAGILNDFGATLTIEESAIVGNQTTGNAGGGIGNSASLILVNSTISGNTALANGGGGGGGGLFNLGNFFSQAPAIFIAINSTIASNTADPDNGGGMLNGFAEVNLVNTIISGNTGGDCLAAFEVTQTSDHSLDSDGTCGLTSPGDQSGVDPLLGPLADNGGPTDTHALLAGSPALDAGNNADCPPTDQRGVARPQGGVCDIGAFELANNAPPNCSGAAPSVARIWPPNHKMVPVSIQSVTDPDGDPVSIQISQVRQDEPTNGLGDGNTCPDAQGLGTATTSVRAERNGQGNGRVYTLSFTATDDQGATCQGSVKVCVPHSSQGNCVDSGLQLDSTVCSGGSTLSAMPGDHSHKSVSSGLSLPCGSHYPTLQCDLECDASVLICQ